MTKQETGREQLEAELRALAGSNAVLHWILLKNRPLTRETYVAMNYPDGAPVWDAELESMPPKPFQKWS